MHKPLTVAEKERLAELVAANTPLGEICEVIGRDRWTTRRNINYLARRPAPERTRSPLRLSLAEREEISRGVAAGESLRSIARRLGRSPSTVSREVAGNGGARRYRAVVADRAALKRARRPKSAKLAVQSELCALVESKLELRWSPQQISGWLSETFPDRPEMQVSHETIYLSLFVQSAAPYAKSSPATCDVARPHAGLEADGPTTEAAARSERWSTSANDPPRQRTGRCRATGKATWCSAPRTARWRPWSSATAGS